MVSKIGFWDHFSGSKTEKIGVNRKKEGLKITTFLTENRENRRKMVQKVVQKVVKIGHFGPFSDPFLTDYCYQASTSGPGPCTPEKVSKTTIFGVLEVPVWRPLY